MTIEGETLARGVEMWEVGILEIMIWCLALV
jgi:hypothetical protein